MFSFVSLLAIAIIVAGIVVAFSGRFLAVGALVITNVLVFVLTAFGPDQVVQGTHLFRAPTVLLELALNGSDLYAAKPVAGLRLVTSMFIHADAGHIFGNMLMLLIFGMPFEERIGHRRFTILYLLTGAFAALLQVGIGWGDPIRLVGASGAVFGILGGFGGAYPKERMRLPIPGGPIFFWIRAPVLVFAMIGAGLQTAYLWVSGNSSNIAFAAHLGGLAAGLVIGFLMVRRSEMGRELPLKTAVDFAKLEPFASDPRAHKALTEMERSHDEPDVFRAWVEEFFRHASDPETGEKVKPGPAGRIISMSGKVHDVRVR